MQKVNFGISRTGNRRSVKAGDRKSQEGSLVFWRWVARASLLVLFGVFPGGFGLHCSAEMSVLTLAVILNFSSRIVRNEDSAQQAQRVKLTKRASESTPNPSSPPSHPDSPQPISLSSSRDAVAPIAAAQTARVALRSAILICEMSEMARRKKVRSLRLRLDSQSAIKRQRVESSGKAILHVLLHIYPVGGSRAVIFAAARATCVATCCGIC